MLIYVLSGIVEKIIEWGVRSRIIIHIQKKIEIKGYGSWHLVKTESDPPELRGAFDVTNRSAFFKVHLCSVTFDLQANHPLNMNVRNLNWNSGTDVLPLEIKKVDLVIPIDSYYSKNLEYSKKYLKDQGSLPRVTFWPVKLNLICSLGGSFVIKEKAIDVVLEL